MVLTGFEEKKHKLYYIYIFILFALFFNWLTLTFKIYAYTMEDSFKVKKTEMPDETIAL